MKTLRYAILALTLMALAVMFYAKLLSDTTKFVVPESPWAVLRTLEQTAMLGLAPGESAVSYTQAFSLQLERQADLSLPSPLARYVLRIRPLQEGVSTAWVGEGMDLAVVQDLSEHDSKLYRLVALRRLRKN